MHTTLPWSETYGYRLPVSAGPASCDSCRKQAAISGAPSCDRRACLNVPTADPRATLALRA